MMLELAYARYQGPRAGPTRFHPATGDADPGPGPDGGSNPQLIAHKTL